MLSVFNIRMTEKWDFVELAGMNNSQYSLLQVFKYTVDLQFALLQFYKLDGRSTDIALIKCTQSGKLRSSFGVERAFKLSGLFTGLREGLRWALDLAGTSQSPCKTLPEPSKESRQSLLLTLASKR